MPGFALWKSPFRDASIGRILSAVDSYEKVNSASTTYLISFSMVEETCQGTETHKVGLKRALFNSVG